MRHRRRVRLASKRRRGASSTIDFVLVVGILLPMIAFIWKFTPRIIRLVYDVILVHVSWPFI
jgi:hypothetical protein